MKGRKVISQVLFRFLLFFICITFSNLQNVYASEQKNILETKVEKFFQKLKTLESDFIQVSPSGKIRMGKIFLDLPGKLRIDYQNPNDLLITCKGMWVVIQNRKLKTTNNILLNQTPFSILLDKRVNFQNKDLNLSLTSTSGIISLKIKVAKNPKVGELTLEFSEKPFLLKKWIIKDIVGDETTVLIQNTNYNSKLPYTLFFQDDFPEPSN